MINKEIGSWLTQNWLHFCVSDTLVKVKNLKLLDLRHNKMKEVSAYLSFFVLLFWHKCECHVIFFVTCLQWWPVVQSPIKLILAYSDGHHIILVQFHNKWL